MLSPEKLAGILSEVSFSTARSGGAGGQHVNKVSSKVILSFNIKTSRVLEPAEKELLLFRLSKRVSASVEIAVFCQEDRSQYRNKEIAIKKFVAILRSAFALPKKRRATKATKASKERRMDSKKRRSRLKKLRRHSDPE